jgi:hypothetical protein
MTSSEAAIPLPPDAAAPWQRRDGGEGTVPAYSASTVTLTWAVASPPKRTGTW